MTDEVISTKTDFVAGIFKFSLKTPESDCGGADQKDVLETARTWLKESCGFRSLLVRHCGKDEFGIEFCYGLQKGETYAKFVYAYTDKLKRRYGNTFVAWDVSDNLDILK